MVTSNCCLFWLIFGKISWKDKDYNFKLVIIDILTKIVRYELIKVTTDALRLAKIILNIAIWQHGLLDSIIINRGLLFISEFWLSLYYFLVNKQILFSAFYLQTNSQTKLQNSIIKAYLWIFINFEQNNLAELLPMPEFVYNNIKNKITGYISFELNYGYYSWVLYKKDVDFCSNSNPVGKLLVEVRELITIGYKNYYHSQEF